MYKNELTKHIKDSCGLDLSLGLLYNKSDKILYYLLEVNLEFITHSADETFSLGFRLASQKIFKSGSIVCFSGEMGSGKTVFIQGALKGMGYDGDVTSPTFALMNVYEANIKVLHYDLYRLNGYDDLYSIGLFDDIGKDNCTFIEWSENADGFLPDGCIFITIEYGGKENERKIKVTGID